MAGLAPRGARVSWVLLMAATVGVCTAHVALTFPPARDYDLDFLDNSRTQGPCGMPKGNKTTMLVQGSTFDVTWHLAYPHQGGYRIELLDQQQRVVADLTNSDGETLLVQGDPTAQTQRVTLPQDTLCSGCVLRLLRQAAEWGPRYQFWSCADVDIVKRRLMREKCSKNGIYMVDKCRCNPGYYGASCQYYNECETDADCGTYGKCVDIDATSYPKKQCYCQQGRFGSKCSKSSLLRQANQVNLNMFVKKELGPRLVMYYRFVKNPDQTDQIEVALVANGTSYIAVGWRPSSVTTTCRQFPYIAGDVGGTMWKQQDAALLDAIQKKKNETATKSGPATAPEPEPESESEPEPESEPASGTTSQPEPEPEPTSSPKEPKPEPEPIKETTTERATQGDVTEKPRSLSDRLSGLLVPNSRGRRSVFQQRRLSRSRRFAVPLLKSGGNETLSGEVVTSTQAEPEPESKAEPNAKAEPEPEAEAEPKAEADSKAEPEPEAEPKASAEIGANAKMDRLSGDTPWVPRDAGLHAMDCTDIVVGTAHGNSYRVMDYYTRDRSTPRPDSFWGGEDSITAALGWEQDGVTTIVFRKPVLATHPSDQAIEKGPMHVIWALGQEPGRYVHSPPSGLEKGAPSVPDFYRRDELKYHGRGDQRGTLTLELLGDSASRAPGAQTVDWCGGQFGSPAGCSVRDNTCKYHARWEYLEGEDLVRYSVTSSSPQRWTGIGFSDNTKMSQTDVVVGFMDGAGEATMFDGWLVGYSSVTWDRQQSISDQSLVLHDGVLVMNFTRRRDTRDKDQDLAFSDSTCLYLVYPVGGGPFVAKSKLLKKHDATPLFSTERVCIRSCKPKGAGDLAGTGIVYTTTPRPPQLQYEVDVLLTGYHNFRVPGQETENFRTLAKDIKGKIIDSFQKLQGFQEMDIASLTPMANGTVKAEIKLLLDKNEHMKGGDLKPLVEDETSGNAKASKVYEVLHRAVANGTLGDLPVDPSYLRVNQLLVSSPSRQTDSGRSEAEPSVSVAGISGGGGGMTAAQFLENNKTWIIVGVVCILIILAIIQAIVTITRIKKRRGGNPAPKSKGPLITNSGFKDYSRGNLNYAYENFETEENGLNGRRISGNGTSGGRGYNGRSNGGPHPYPGRGGSPMRETRENHNHHNNTNGYHDTYSSNNRSHKSSHGSNMPLQHYTAPGSNTALSDTRSLQRPRQGPVPRDRGWSTSGTQDPRTTYSLPRGAHAAPGAGYDRNPMAENTPDFYYLPSQRKYSGEVVRVYVDYNKAK